MSNTKNQYHDLKLGSEARKEKGCFVGEEKKRLR